MATRAPHPSSGLLALWLLLAQFSQQAWCQTKAGAVVPDTTAPSPAAATPTFVSPERSEQEEAGGLSENVKTGISVAVTLGSIILVASITIWCVIRRRNRALSNPERRMPAPGEIDEESGAVAPIIAEDGFGFGLGKGKEEVYQMMTPTTPSGSSRSPVRFMLQNESREGYPTVPEPVYPGSRLYPLPLEQQQQQQHHQHAHMNPNMYPEGQPADMTPAYVPVPVANAFPGIHVSDYSQQNEYATYHRDGQQIIQVPPPPPPPHQEHEQQLSPETEHISWIYPLSATSSTYPESSDSLTMGRSTSMRQQHNGNTMQAQSQYDQYLQERQSPRLYFTPSPEHDLDQYENNHYNDNNYHHQEQQQQHRHHHQYEYEDQNQNQNQNTQQQQQQHEEPHNYQIEEQEGLNNVDLSAFMSYPGETHNHNYNDDDDDQDTNKELVHSPVVVVPSPPPNVSELADPSTTTKNVNEEQQQQDEQQHHGYGYYPHVPPPRPNVSELPDQRRPVEMMGDGHFHEAP